MSAPVCKICKKTEGVTFNIFTPAIPPFGTACVSCEKKVELWLRIWGHSLVRGSLEDRLEEIRHEDKLEILEQMRQMEITVDDLIGMGKHDDQA